MGELVPWIAIGLAFSLLASGMRMRAAARRSGAVRRGFSRRNLPNTFLGLGILLGLTALIVGLGPLAMSNGDDLKPLAGIIGPPPI